MTAPTTERDPFADSVLTADEVAAIQAAFDKDDYDTLDLEALAVSHERLRMQLAAVLAELKSGVASASPETPT